MRFYQIQSGPLMVNTYILTDEQSGETAIIDPGQHNDELFEYIKTNKCKYKYLILTHGHFDHSIDAAACKKLLPDIKIAIHKADAAALYDDRESLFAKYTNKPSEPCRADMLLEGGETLMLGKTPLKIIHTPGHSKGGICIACEHMLFSGDTLFYRSVGRTDLGGGDYGQLKNSVKALFALDGDYTVYPGHEDSTLLSDERKYNIFGITDAGTKKKC